MSIAITSASSAKWYTRAARFGLVSKGIVYCLSGLIAVMAALEIGSNSAGDAGKEGVFSFIKQQPFGKWIILLIGVGLICYTIWRCIQAFRDTEHKGDDRKGLSKRAAYLFSGLVYAGLAVYCFKVFIGSSQNSNNGEESWAATLLQQPFGQWLVFILAAIIIGVGCYQIYRGVSGKYKKYVREGMKDAASWISAVGVAGYTARGIVWLIIGWLFIRSALHANAKEAGGTDAALQWLRDSSYGSVLLMLVGAGLVCYGLFMFLRARYQHIHM